MKVHRLKENVWYNNFFYKYIRKVVDNEKQSCYYD